MSVAMKCTRAIGICIFSIAVGWSAPVDAAEIIFVSDFDNSQTIQWVRHHSAKYPGVSIDSGAAFVTAAKNCNMMGNYTMFIQVPAALNGNPAYPEYSALKVFGPCAGFAPGIGDCVSVDGAMTEFNGSTELSQGVFTILPGSACGATPVVPYTSTSLAEVATDSNAATIGNQPGPRAEALESVLLQLNSLQVTSGNDGSGDFQVTGEFAPGPILVIGNTLFQYNTVVGSHLSVTGVLDEQDLGGTTTYQLLPRAASDVVVVP